jgi:SHS2 domain-containing protein
MPSPPSPPSPPQASVGYFDHDADIGIVGRGRSIEQAFVAAAVAMFDLSCDTSSVQSAERVDIAFKENDVEYALIAWLNALLTQAHARGLALGRFALERDGAAWRGTAWGEPWRADLTPGIGVKGATLTMLSVRQHGQAWEARCVVDV